MIDGGFEYVALWHLEFRRVLMLMLIGHEQIERAQHIHSILLVRTRKSAEEVGVANCGDNEPFQMYEDDIRHVPQLLSLHSSAVVLTILTSPLCLQWQILLAEVRLQRKHHQSE